MQTSCRWKKLIDRGISMVISNTIDSICWGKTNCKNIAHHWVNYKVLRFQGQMSNSTIQRDRDGWLLQRKSLDMSLSHRMEICRKGWAWAYESHRKSTPIERQPSLSWIYTFNRIQLLTFTKWQCRSLITIVIVLSLFVRFFYLWRYISHPWNAYRWKDMFP